MARGQRLIRLRAPSMDAKGAYGTAVNAPGNHGLARRSITLRHSMKPRIGLDTVGGYGKARPALHLRNDLSFLHQFLAAQSGIMFVIT